MQGKYIALLAISCFGLGGIGGCVGNNFARGANDAKLEQQAQQYLERMQSAESRAYDLANSLIGSEALARNIAKQLEAERAAYKRDLESSRKLGEQLNVIDGGIENAFDRVNRIEALVRDIQDEFTGKD